MGRRLGGEATVYVIDEDGRPKALPPGSEPTAAEAEQITNPDVWAAEDEDEESPATPAPRRKGGGHGSKEVVAVDARQGA